jgi:hypothetical protein
MRKMKPQRREKGIGGKWRLRNCGGTQRKIARFDARKRRYFGLSTVQVALAGPEKDARASPAFVQAVIPARLKVVRAATIDAPSGVDVGRLDR